MLRFAGSIAWPVKPNRIAELTTFHSLDGPRVYFDGQLAKAFPSVAAKDEAAGIDFGEFGVSVESLLRKARANDGWHNAVLVLVAHWVSRNWADTEILAVAESITCHGYRVEQTRAELLTMIRGAREKWSTPDAGACRL